MKRVATGSCSQIEHGAGGQAQHMLFPRRPGLLGQEARCRLHVGRADRTIVAFQEEQVTRPPLVVVEQRSTEGVLVCIDDRHPSRRYLPRILRSHEDRSGHC